MAAKSLEKAMEVQTEYPEVRPMKASSPKRPSSASFTVDLAKESYKPFEGVIAKATMMK